MILFLIPGILLIELSILKIALNQGFLCVNTLEPTEFSNIFEIKGTITLSFPDSNAFINKSLKSKSFARIGLFLDKVNFPSQFPKLFNKLRS